MKPLNIIPAVFVCLAMHTAVNANTDSIPINSFALKQSYRPVFRLTAKDIAHLPFTNIMELLNGRFPFVFLDPPSTLDYNFLVDGHLLLNPDAVNVSQIASIEFYPIAFTVGNGLLSRKGTFVIITKNNTSAESWSFRSQAGVVFPTDRSFPVFLGANYPMDKTKEFFTHQEAGYAYHSGRLQLSSAISYTRNPSPGYTATYGNDKHEHNYNWQRVRFSNFVGYKLSERVRLTGALLATSQGHRTDEVARDQGGQVFAEANGKEKTIYLAAQAGAEIRVSRNIVNTLQFEYAYTRLRLDFEGIYYQPPPTENGLTFADAKSSTKRFAVTNALKGTLMSTQQLTVGWELLFRYYEERYKTNQSYLTQTQSGQNQRFSTSSSWANIRSTAVMPRLNVVIGNALFATAGFTYDSWKVSPYPVPDKYKLMPHAGLRWSLKNAGEIVTSLNLHSTFGKFMQHSGGNDYLEAYPMQRLNHTFGFYTPSGLLLPGKLWISGADAGFVNNQLLLSVNYMRGKAELPPAGIIMGTNLIIIPLNVKREGVSADLQATLANRENFSLRLRTILFYERDKLVDNYYPGARWNEDDFTPNDFLPPQWRGSVEANLTIKKFFFSANALLRFTEAKAGPLGWERFSNHGLTFITAGYELPKGLQIALQGKNLLSMKEPVSSAYYGSKYVGVSLNYRL
jgi:hypothetical protein